MKTTKIIFLLSIIVLLQSCYKPGKITIKNNISQVKIQSVKWGDILIASSLLPGESSSPKIINKYSEKLPSSKIISFKMTANDKTVYLETTEKFLLKEDDDIIIVLDDNTLVFSPNQ